MTAPWASRATAALLEPVEHVWVTTFTHPSEPEPISLEVENGTITFDESWSPHVQASLTCKVPADQEILDLLDPRTGGRVQVYGGYRYNDGTTDVHLLGDLGIRDRVVRRPQNQMVLAAHSDEALLQDDLWAGGTNIPQTGLYEAISWCLEQVFTDPDIATPLSPEVSPELLTDTVMELGDTFWEAVAAVADFGGLWVYDDGTRTWHIDPRPANAGSSVHQLLTGPTGNITGSEAGLGRDDGWANAVLLVHQWRDSGGTDHVRKSLARVTSGSMSVANAGMKATTVRRSIAATQAAINKAAAGMVNRTISRGRAFNVEAPSAYWVRPGTTVTISLPTGPQERHLVASTSFRFPSGAMSVRTRVPQDVTITSGE